MKRFIFLLFLFGACHVATMAARLSPDAQISLITCAPGSALYTKFGHTAIRVYDPAAQNDIVFNYGMFSFYADHFYSRFVKGETDYELGINSMSAFCREYVAKKRPVYEQVLNLTHDEKEALLDALLLNYRPENRVYRYNFVFDNCATRPYYLIVKHVHGRMEAPVFETRQDTYRDIIDHYTGPTSWAAFGINLIFGKDADQVMTSEQRMFLPEELMNYVSEATVHHAAGVKKLVSREQTGVFAVPEDSGFGMPLLCVMLVVLLTAVVSVWDLQRDRTAYWYDACLFLVYGLLGTLMFYLSFVSLHPLVKNNFNLLLMNPLMFVPFVLCLFKKGQAVLSRMRWIVLAYYVLAFAVWLCSGQTKHVFVWIVAVHLMRVIFVWYLRPKVNGRFSRISTIGVLLAVFCTSSQRVVAQHTQSTPRLLVTVVVDGLQRQNLVRLENYLGQGGLRTLLQEGSYFPYIYFPHRVNGGVESVATICTGTIPYYHGIMENCVFDVANRSVRHSLADADNSGIGTDENLSPRKLLATTFADELKLMYGKECKIYAVGVSAAETIVLAGHNANAVAWLDDKAMRWASTNFYAEGLPACADEMNVSGRFAQMARREWTPRMNCSLYLSPTEKELKNGFSYQVDQSQKSAKSILKKTPMANALVIELALKIQEQERLGEDLHPDLLMLHLTTETPAGTGDYISTAEQEDMYMRLNQDLGLLLDQLVKRVGKEHLLVALVGKPHAGYGTTMLEAHGIPAGCFNTERSAALINTYLMALYGHERWIDGCYDNHIYLNRLLIEQRKMNLEEMQKQVANFLMEFEGVQNACTVSQLRAALSPDEQGSNKLQNSCHMRTCGDVVFTLHPGWVVVDKKNQPIDRVQETNPTAPFFLWGMNSENHRVDDMISATEIAPYLCHRLSLPFPNACFGQESIREKNGK